MTTPTETIAALQKQNEELTDKLRQYKDALTYIAGQLDIGCAPSYREYPVALTELKESSEASEKALLRKKAAEENYAALNELGRRFANMFNTLPKEIPSKRASIYLSRFRECLDEHDAFEDQMEGSNCEEDA